MFGTVASFAGPHRSVSTSMRNESTTSPSKLSKNGSSASNPARPMSQLTITTLRFHRSTSAPPNGARMKPGSIRAVITRPTAVPELETLVASARIATSPIQSPRLDTTCASQIRMNPGTRNTDREGGIGWSSGWAGMNGAGSLTRRPA